MRAHFISTLKDQLFYCSPLTERLGNKFCFICFGRWSMTGSGTYAVGFLSPKARSGKQLHTISIEFV